MNYLKLHGNCLLVKGASRALIYDVFRNRTIGLNLNMAELYENEISKIPYNEILERYKSWKSNIEQFCNYLIENDFAFFTDEPENFPTLNTTFKKKNRIYSSVIEINNKLLKEYPLLLNNFISLDCKIFYLIVREKINDLDKFEKLLNVFKESRATFVQVIMDRPYLDLHELKKITHDMRITYKIFDSGKDELIKGRWWHEESIFKFNIVEHCSRPFDIDVKTNYGIGSFLPIQSIFLESQNHNPFFNSKVCIDMNGDYKNDLAFKETFGNFQTRTLQELLKDSAFKRLWNISNDKIEKCKDCQNRYQCMSNSNIVQHKGKYNKIDTCNFDPYKNIWTD